MRAVVALLPVGLDYLGGTMLYVRSVWSGQLNFFGNVVNGYQVDETLQALDLATDG